MAQKAKIYKSFMLFSTFLHAYLVEEKLNLPENNYSRKNSKHQAAELKIAKHYKKLKLNVVLRPRWGACYYYYSNEDNKQTLLFLGCLIEQKNEIPSKIFDLVQFFAGY